MHTSFILATIAPIFLIIFLGWLLKRRHIINDNFVAVASTLIFTLTLPTLVFLKVSSLRIDQAIQWSVIGWIYGVTIVVYLVTWIVASRLITNGRDLGAFLQGIYRGNFATVGLAASAGIYGVDGLAEAALYLAFIVPLYNILGVVALVVPLGKEHHLTGSMLVREVFLNPIVLAVFVALPFAYFQITIPDFLVNTGNYLAELTIPLALLGIGATLKFHGRSYSLTQAVSASLVKVVVMPLVGLLAIIVGQVSGTTAGILMILFACPTTMATFIMAQAMGANEKLSSAIVVIATSISAVTLIMWLAMVQRVAGG